MLKTILPKVSNIIIFIGLVQLSLISCNSGSKVQNLPYLGFHEVVEGDTIYHKIPAFKFVDQDSNEVTNADFDEKVYVADFFFTRCPTICPKLTRSMKRLHDEFADEADFLLISHSIDTYNDSVSVLKRYAGKLGVTSDRWHFITGNRTKIYDLADAYFSVALEDPSVPGGFDHSGRLILVDRRGHVRSFCDGTIDEEVDAFMNDIKFLLQSGE